MIVTLICCCCPCSARRGSRKLQALTSEQRAQVLIKLAELLQSRKQEILSENNKDLVQGEKAGKHCNQNQRCYLINCYLILLFVRIVKATLVEVVPHSGKVEQPVKRTSSDRGADKRLSGSSLEEDAHQRRA